MTTATIEELQDLREAQANHVRETWISAMELRLVKNELQKCHQYEGVNHYSVCEPLANKYVDMLKDHKVKDSAYVYIGGLHTGLTEGDVITILSQFGEIADINMPKDKSNGKSRGFGFVMFEDQRSTILAVDNLNGSQVLGRSLRVDHVDNYKQPKANKDEEPVRESMNASWQLHANKDHDEDEDENENEDSDTLDPMAEYIKQQQNSSKSKDKEERKKRKLERAHKRELKELKRKRI